MILQRLTVTYAPDGPRLSVRYTTPDGPRPGTKARVREVEALARRGLTDALEALEGDVASIGEAGFVQREDVLQLASPDTARTMKRGA